jgi:hypothetical protein
MVCAVGLMRRVASCHSQVPAGRKKKKQAAAKQARSRPEPATPANDSKTPPTTSSVAQAQRWTITKKDEILLIASFENFPHLYPLSRTDTWPIGPERLRVIQTEAKANNPSALSLLGTHSPSLCQLHLPYTTQPPLRFVLWL